MENENEIRGHCGIHPEFVKATSDLMGAVNVLSNNVKWIVAIGKGLFTVGLALIVTTLLAIYSAGQLSTKVDSLNIDLTALKEEYYEHALDRKGHHD